LIAENEHADQIVGPVLITRRNGVRVILQRVYVGGSIH
jgi:hypothetical protein